MDDKILKDHNIIWTPDPENSEKSEKILASFIRSLQRVEAKGYFPKVSIVAARNIGDEESGQGDAATVIGEFIVGNTGSRYWDSPESMQKEAYDKRNNSTPDPDHSMIHELGHVLNWPDKERTMDSIKDIPPGVGDTLSILGVSKYAVTSPMEFISEVFAAKIVGVKVSDNAMKLYRTLHGPMSTLEDSTK
jgi:hypothetical protein